MLSYPVRADGRAPYLFRLLLIAAIFGAVPIFSAAFAEQSGWDLKVCVAASEPPASDQAHGGYEEKIAAVIAQQLGARLQLVYTQGAGNGYGVQHDLAPGACDAIMGAPEGAQGLVNTVPYYRAPYVFVYRSDATFHIKGLNDPVLKKLSVAVPPNSLLAGALQDAGFASSVVPVSPNYTIGGAGSMKPLVDAVKQGKAQVAMVFGPYASAFVNQPSSGLAMTPVSPEITLAGYPMFHIETIGVRPGDDSLQRELNNALAGGWDKIQGILKAAGVPMLSVPKPVASPTQTPRPLVVGLVLPVPTGVAARTDHAAMLAKVAGSLAENFVGQAVGKAGGDLKVRVASSPDASVARRAARRLVQVDHASALVGGIGEGQAQALAQVAAELGVPFLNIGDGSSGLRTTCTKTTFNVAASSAMQLDALARWSVAQGRKRWFVVSQGKGEKALAERARNALSKAGNGTSIVGTADVAPGTSIYYDVFDHIRSASPDLVVLLMDPVKQGLFISQVPKQGLGAPVTGVLPVYAQDRQTFTRLQQDNPAVGSGYRVVQWDAALGTSAAKGLNGPFISQAAAPIDGGAWSTFMAIKIVADASIATKSVAPAALAQYLSDPSHSFDLDKGVALSFRPWDHQLRQPLYIVKIDPNAHWSASPSDRVALASVAATVPATTGSAGNAATLLDTLGDGPGASTCQ